MDVTFVGIICFINNQDGSYRAVLPDGTKGNHPCNQYGSGKTDAHVPLICASGLTGKNNWAGSIVLGQFGLFPIKTAAPLEIGNISQGKGVDDAGARAKLRSLTAFDPQFEIDTRGHSYLRQSIAWVDIKDGKLVADTSGVADTTTLVLGGGGTITLKMGGDSFEVDETSGAIYVLNASWGTSMSGGASHFYLYYLLDKNPHCKQAPVPSTINSSSGRSLLDFLGNANILTLMADCSNTTYP